jgi:hypothetical protein
MYLIIISDIRILFLMTFNGVCVHHDTKELPLFCVARCDTINN